MKKVAQKAFTMIELLVVIAVIGVMATAVLSAINPLEQINKGNDTALRSDAEQLISGVDRYFASLGYFPWQNGQNDNYLNIAWLNVVELDNSKSFLNNLEGTQEIKHGFTLRLQDTTRTPIYVLYDNTSASPTLYSCFQPKSNSFLTEASNRCKNTTSTPGTPFGTASQACGGTVGPTTPCNTTTTKCYVCLP